MQLMYHHQEITENAMSKGLTFVDQGEPLDTPCRFGRQRRVLSPADGPVHRAPQAQSRAPAGPSKAIENARVTAEN
jgi:hypothetical protein